MIRIQLKMLFTQERVISIITWRTAITLVCVIPVYLAKGGGTIIVDIAVDRQGRVIKAEPRNNNGVKDPMLPEYAQNAALRTLFNADQTAPKIQTGTITYTFVAQ